ncbi:MAG: TIGR03790 family protein [Phycisphaerae bacterium]|jgi:uncharacterized protein (TIGR03790 family)|nr:TIGR03790 family protein [Phycisphaerae bacterium]
MKKILIALTIIVLALSTHLANAQTDSAPITPEQVLIIANTKHFDSMDLAKFYAKERKISPRNILPLDLPTQEQISFDQYETKIAKPIRSFLRQQKLENKIRVLLTMYGVPLKIAQARPTAAQRKISQNVQTHYNETLSQLNTQIDKLEQMAGVADALPSTQPQTQAPDSFKTQLPKIAQKIEGYYRVIIPELQAIKDPVDRDTRANDFGRIRLAIEGQSAFIAGLKAQRPLEGQKLEEQIKKQQAELQTLLQIPPENRDIDKSYALAEEIGGLVLKLKTIYEDFAALNQKDSAAAVDSELSLVLWENYPRAGRLPNPLNPRLANHPAIVNQKQPVLMVARLDGPDADSVKRIIRDSIAAESQGLTGKFYIDARGITKKDGFYVYDQNLRDLAQTIKINTEIPVILDDNSELFKPDTCPDTALYCGWYSLRKYIPSCTFVPGSVGYHIASFEATSLKKPNSTEWVQNMIKNGIAATLGAVNEPYLDAFPLPSEFFGLLLTGNYTFVEVFYKTNRYLSWQIIPVADPLYRPFKKNPQIREEEIELKNLPALLIN